MSKPCKGCKPTECEECPEWIFTFADLVMLMMGFFVILWVLKPPAGKSNNDQQVAAAEEQWLVTVGEIRKGLGYEPNPKSADPVDKAMIRQQNGHQKGAENETPRESAVGTDHRVTSVRPGKQSVVGGRLGFDMGDARLLPETTRAIEQIAEKIVGHSNIVVVKGHASVDDLTEGGAPQRMELSIRRAQAVADFLISKGVSPEVLRVQGCSTFEPVKQHAYNPNAQAENRRVEVEATAEMVEDRQDPDTAAMGNPALTQTPAAKQ